MLMDRVRCFTSNNHGGIESLVLLLNVPSALSISASHSFFIVLFECQGSSTGKQKGKRNILVIRRGLIRTGYGRTELFEVQEYNASDILISAALYHSSLNPGHIRKSVWDRDNLFLEASKKR